MKKTILLNIFLLLVSGLYAQYISFPIGKAIWKSNEMKGVLTRQSFEYPNPTNSFDTRIYYQKGDTIMNSLLYHKIYEKIYVNSDTWDYGFYGALREDIPAKKVYFKGPEWNSEKLIFDFNLKVNDTIRGWYSLDSLPSSSYFVVRNIVKKKYRSTSTIERNVYELEAFNLPSWAYTFSSICILYEGIGFHLGFLKSPILSTKYKRPHRQSCYSDETVEIFDCESNNIGASESGVDISSLISIYPNPTANELFIKTELQISKLLIYDSRGNNLLQLPYVSKIITEDFSTGLYLLVAIDEKGNRAIHKFEKK